MYPVQEINAMWLLDEHAPHTIITNVIATLTDSISTDKFFTKDERVSHSGCCQRCAGVARVTRSKSKAFAYMGFCAGSLFLSNGHSNASLRPSFAFSCNCVICVHVKQLLNISIFRCLVSVISLNCQT